MARRYGDTTPTQDNANVFDDEFEADDFDGIADGFRPGQSHDREGDSRHSHDAEPVRSVSARYSSVPAMLPSGSSRNSTRKSRGQQEDPFASPEDETEPPLERTPSGNFAPSITHRSVSSASSRQFAGTTGPRFGAGGPSHPYEMYPQATVARTPSLITTSTARPGRHSTSRDGPQHPYAMYPQGVDEDIADETEEAQNPVPVGFLGLGQSYQRRRGPDGEEQDIIGDYGHSEQLPPYSRYPDEGPEKVPLLDVPQPPSALHSRAPVLGTDPGMSLMHQLLLPVQQSMTDESDLARQTSRLSRMSSMPVAEDHSSSSTLVSKKSWGEKSWKERRKTKIFGIPFWCYLLAAGVCAFIAAVLGGVIGGFVEGQEHGQKKPTVTVVSTSLLYDASLIATPSSTSPPTGTFALSLGTPQETQAGCLITPGQQAAWGCNVANADDIAININVPAGSNHSGAYLYSVSGVQDSQLSYGSQAGNMQTMFSPFLLVTDNDDPQNGAAFYFQQQYDKLVVVPGDAFTAPSQQSKREANEMTSDWKFTGVNNLATPGDRPWFCWFNSTFVEGFIYPGERAVTTTSSSKSSHAFTTSSTSATSTHGASPTPTSTGMTADPTETITTTITMPSTTCTYSGVASSFMPWVQSNYPEYLNPTGTGPSMNKRQENNGYYEDVSMPIYPYQVKIEERRIPGSPPPYCVQYQVLNDGSWNWVPNSSGGQIIIQLDEQDPGYSAYESAGVAGSRRSKQKRMIPGACHCQWVSGQ